MNPKTPRGLRAILGAMNQMNQFIPHLGQHLFWTHTDAQIGEILGLETKTR